MIQITDLTLRYEGSPIFEDINFLINREDRIGLVGKNGAGKTTLLQLLKGHTNPDEGHITYPRNCKIGYLPQELEAHSELTVIEETQTAFAHIQQMEKELDDLNRQLAERTDYHTEAYMNLLQQMHDKEEAFRLAGGYNIEGLVEQVLKGLGFNEADFGQPVNTFSGGWQMRIELAKILLQKPDLLLLDEPTNHLDIMAIRWLEQFLQTFEGAVMVVSHDIAFLDQVTNRTIEIMFGRLEDYKAPFSKYIELRQEKKAQQQAAKKDQERKKAQMERNIERFRAKPNKAKFAKKLMRELENMEDVEVESDDRNQVNIQFPVSRREGKVVAKGEQLSKSYGEKPVINGLNFEIQRGDRIAFVGKNGMGKSTLAKVITGEIQDFNGHLEWGHNIDLGYFAQHQPQKLDPEKTLMQVMEDSASPETRPHIRSILGAFLFSGETVFKKVKVLSGGEKSRLALAEMLLHPVNVLVLDEPTNHLDMLSKEVLKEALMDFGGTIIVVSHDRNFMEDLTNKVFEFREDGIRVYPGDINTFLHYRDLEDFRALESEQTASNQKHNNAENGQEAKPKNDEQKSGKADHKEKQAREKDLKKLKNKISQHEKTIEELEHAIAHKEEQLNNPETHGIDVNDPQVYQEYEEQKRQLEEAMETWEADCQTLKDLEQ